MEKKYYQVPKIKIVKLELTDLICTSNGDEDSGASTESLDEEEFKW